MKKNRNEKLLIAMDLVDEQYIEEARQIASGEIKTKERKNRFVRRAALSAACFAVAFTALNLWLFLPIQPDYADISMYKDNEYYSIIDKLNRFYTPKPLFKNNFEMLLSFLNIEERTPATDLAVTMGSASGEATPEYDTNVDYGGTSTSPDDGANYEEVTDNQVEGVIEGDRIKRSDRYIYYLNDSNENKTADILEIYSIEGAESKKVGQYVYSNSNAQDISQEFYLSDDCSTIYWIIQLYKHQNVRYPNGELTILNYGSVKVLSLDVTDPANIQKTAEFSITGGYQSSRMVNGELMLFTGFNIIGQPDFSDESSFVPQIDRGNGLESLPLDNIVAPDELSDASYSIVTKLSGKSLTLSDSVAFLSFAGGVYVSKDTIYAFRSYADTKDHLAYTQESLVTEIIGVSYSSDEYTRLGSITVDGSVKNKYYLDEYKGILRVVTTIQESRIPIGINSTEESSFNASLYCIDLKNWSIRAKVENFAPEGETVESVRFDKNTAYVCTARVVELTDPVFFFDLSDLDNITCKDTGTIDGYSSSLVNFGDGYLLGIGFGSSSDKLKIEVYEETETGVQSVDFYQSFNTSFSEDYKSYYIDREHKLIGLGYYLYGGFGPGQKYLLLHFDGSNLKILLQEPLEGQTHLKRGVWIDGYFYLFGQDDFKVIEVNLG